LRAVQVLRRGSGQGLSQVLGRAFKCLGRLMQIAGAIIDDSDTHRCTPG
jgi:hypothetical protein